MMRYIFFFMRVLRESSCSEKVRSGSPETREHNSFLAKFMILYECCSFQFTCCYVTVNKTSLLTFAFRNIHAIHAPIKLRITQVFARRKRQGSGFEKVWIECTVSHQLNIKHIPKNWIQQPSLTVTMARESHIAAILYWKGTYSQIQRTLQCIFYEKFSLNLRQWVNGWPIRFGQFYALSF